MKNTRSNVWSGLLLGVVVGAAALAVTPGVAAADGACGTKENPCPLQKWMRTNMGPANASGDMPALAAALDKAAGFAPDPAWNAGDAKTSWKGIAQAGAAAARANDAAAVKASCKSCHDAYKDKYKAQFRTKAVPG
jgi:hypothetical protein